jgi:hypothetical protein
MSHCLMDRSMPYWRQQSKEDSFESCARTKPREQGFVWFLLCWRSSWYDAIPIRDAPIRHWLHGFGKEIVVPNNMPDMRYVTCHHRHIDWILTKLNWHVGNGDPRWQVEPFNKEEGNEFRKRQRDALSALSCVCSCQSITVSSASIPQRAWRAQVVQQEG